MAGQFGEHTDHADVPRENIENLERHAVTGHGGLDRLVVEAAALV